MIKTTTDFTYAYEERSLSALAGAGQVVGRMGGIRTKNAHVQNRFQYTVKPVATPKA